MSTKEKSYNETEVDSLKLMVKIAQVHGRIDGIVDCLKWADRGELERLLRKVSRDMTVIAKMERSSRLDFSKN